MTNEQARAIAMLKDTPGHKALKEVIGEKKEEMADQMKKRIMRGENVSFEQQQFLYGLLRGMDIVLDYLKLSTKLQHKEVN